MKVGPLLIFKSSSSKCISDFDFKLHREEFGGFSPKIAILRSYFNEFKKSVEICGIVSCYVFFVFLLTNSQFQT